MLAQRLRMIDAIDTNDAAKPARPPGFDPSDRVVEDCCLVGSDIERSGGGEESVGSWLSFQVLTIGNFAVDALLE